MWERFFKLLKPKITFESWEGDVKTLPPPDTVTIPLSLPGDIPFEPIVEVGDHVKTGQFIAMRSNKTAVHATITGKVQTIGPEYLWEGEEVLALTIERAGDEELFAPHAIKDLQRASKDDILNTLAELGFNMPWKPESLQHTLTDLEKIPINTVIIQAVDLEPPLCVQRRFLTEFFDDFKESVIGLQKVSNGAKFVIIAHQEFETIVRKELPDVEVFPVDNSTLDTNITLNVHKITGKFYSAHDNPRQDGIVIFSAEDLAFAARCLHKGKPRTNKLITLSAPQLEKPVTVRVRLGTPVKHVLDHFNIQCKSGDRIVFNGPLMGVAQPSESASLCREVDGVIYIPNASVVPFSDRPCINCGRCNQVCPVRIQVNLVGRYAEFGLFENAVLNGSGSCVECGMCAYVCPSRRPLVQYMRFANVEYTHILENYREEQERLRRMEEEMDAAEELENKEQKEG